MKKIFVAVIALLLSKVSFSQPSQDPSKPPPPEERWQHDSKRINEALGLSQAQLDKLKLVFLDFYKDMDQLKEKIPPPPPPPPPSKEEMDKIMSKRNDGLKKIMSAEQFQKFSEVDKQLGPPKHAEHPAPPPQKTSPTK